MAWTSSKCPFYVQSTIYVQSVIGILINLLFAQYFSYWKILCLILMVTFFTEILYFIPRHGDIILSLFTR